MDDEPTQVVVVDAEPERQPGSVIGPVDIAEPVDTVDISDDGRGSARLEHALPNRVPRRPVADDGEVVVERAFGVPPVRRRPGSLERVAARRSALD